MKKNLTQLIQENTVLKRQVAEYKQVLGGSHFVDDSLIKGGFHVVQTIQERNKIDCCHRKPGMRVVVVGDDQSFKEFELVSSSCKTNSWREIISSADESTVRLISDYSELGPDLTTQLHLNQKLKEIVVSLQNILDNLPPPVDISGKANTNASNLLQTDVISWRDALNVYSKSETYSKSEVNTKQEIEGILEDYVTETTFRDAVSGLETSKLDTPSNTVTNTTTYPFLVLTKANGVESARIAAGDVGKNVANAALTSINGAGLTLGADWNITSGSGFYFGLKGLLDKSADATWNRLIMTDASGRVAYSNGKNVIKSMPSVLTEAEKTAWKTEMNGGWTTNTMSVGLLSPIVVKKQNVNSWITLKGANLNLNPANFSVEIVDITGTTVLATVPNSQVQLYSNGIDLTFYYNFNAFALGNYKIRLNNGVATYTTGLAFTLTDAVNTVDLTTITWTSLLHTPGTIGVLSTNQGSLAYTSRTANKAFANDSYTVAAAKSSQIVPSNVNFYLKITGSYTSPNLGGTAGNLGVDTIGLCNANSGLVLGNISNIAVNVILSSYRTQDTLKINSFNETNILAAIDAVSDAFEFVVVRQNNNVVALLGYGSVYKYITIGDVPSAISLFGCFQNNVNNKTSNLVLKELYTF